MKTSNAGIILGLVVVVLLATVLAWFGLYSPALAARTDAQEQTLAAQDQNDILETQLGVLKLDYAQLPALAAELEAVRTDLPLRQDLAGVRNILQAAFDSYDVTLVNSSVGDATLVDPGTQSLVDAAAEVGTTPPSDGASFGSLVATPITVTVQGEYRRVAGMLTELQLGEHRFLYVESSSIVASGDEDENLYTGTFELRAFTYVNENVNPTLPEQFVDAEPTAPGAGDPYENFTGSN